MELKEKITLDMLTKDSVSVLRHQFLQICNSFGTRYLGYLQLKTEHRFENVHTC